MIPYYLTNSFKGFDDLAEIFAKIKQEHYSDNGRFDNTVITAFQQIEKSLQEKCQSKSDTSSVDSSNLGFIDQQWYNLMSDFPGGRADSLKNYTINLGNYLFGCLEHTFFNLIKTNNIPMLTSLLVIVIGFTALNFAISSHIPEIRMARNETDKIISSFYVTVQLLTFRNLKEPPTSKLGKLMIIMQQIIFFLILLFFFQHFAGAYVMRQWMS
mgnify:FL=1